MANHTVQNAKHSALGAAAHDNITLNGCRAGIIRVRNRATSGAPIYFRIYPLGRGSKPDFAAAADDTHCVPWGEFVDYCWASETAFVKMISADAQAYSVESLPGLN